MRRFIPQFIEDPGAMGLLVLRVVSGFALILHGYPKMVHAFSWMGPESHVPAYVQAAIPLVQFFGGVLLLLGFLTPIAALLIFLQMGFAVRYFQSKGDLFVVPMHQTGTSYETALVYMAIALMFLLVGPGIHSVDKHLFGRGDQETPRGSGKRANEPAVLK